jgi:hypothetical protein
MTKVASTINYNRIRLHNTDFGLTLTFDDFGSILICRLRKSCHHTILFGKLHFSHLFEIRNSETSYKDLAWRVPSAQLSADITADDIQVSAQETVMSGSDWSRKRYVYPAVYLTACCMSSSAPFLLKWWGTPQHLASAHSNLLTL